MKKGPDHFTGLRKRIGLFISCAMGFETGHSAGCKFYDSFIKQDPLPECLDVSGRDLRPTARDIEVRWSVVDCPPCAEREIFLQTTPRPLFNNETPKKCKSDDCPYVMKSKRDTIASVACVEASSARALHPGKTGAERLIPPPELDDFLVGMSASTSITKPGSAVRAKSDKPSFMRWNDDAENEQAVTSWKNVLVEGTKKMLALGLPLDTLPMKQAVDGDTNFISPREVRPDLHIETNASSELIMQWLSKMLLKKGKPKGFVQIVTRAGKTIELPQEAKAETSTSNKPLPQTHEAALAAALPWV